MRHNFKFFSAILLLVFSINLMAEISFSVSGIADLHSTKTNLSYTKNHSFNYQNGSQQSKDVDSDHSNCEDHCCPFGGCPLSHCSQVPLFNSSNNIMFFSASLDLNPIYFDFLFPNSPYLEGLRRPPRIS